MKIYAYYIFSLSQSFTPAKNGQSPFFKSKFKFVKILKNKWYPLKVLLKRF